MNFTLSNQAAESTKDMLIVVAAILLSVLLGALLVIPQLKKNGNFSLSCFREYSTNLFIQLQGAALF